MMIDNKNIGVVPYWNLVHDDNMKEYYEYYKPIINRYLRQFNREIFDNDYDEAGSCKFVCKYIATVDGLNKIIVFCEDTFKATWKIILESFNLEENTTTFEEHEVYILEELTNEEYFKRIINMYKPFLYGKIGGNK